MKNVRKRFLSLIMAMMMILSCVATAYAVDATDTTSASDDSVIVLSSADGDDGIMPLSIYQPVYQSPQSTTGVTTINEVSIKGGNEVLLSIVSNVQVQIDIYQEAFVTNGQMGYKWVKGFYCASTNNAGLTYNLGSDYSGTYRFVITPTSSGNYTLALGLRY